MSQVPKDNEPAFERDPEVLETREQDQKPEKPQDGTQEQNPQELSAHEQKQEQPEGTVPISADSEEDSTIFSAPVHTQSEKPKRTRMLRNSLIVLLALAIVATGTFAIIKLIPKLEDENAVSDLSIKLVDYETEDIAAFSITNENGTVRCTSRVADDTSSEQTEADSTGLIWSLEGVDSDLTNSATIGFTADAVASVSAMRQMTDLNVDYGLDQPRITVSVEGRSGSGIEPYTLLVGNEAPDLSGSYVKLEGHDEVYLVEKATIDEYEVKDVSFASLTAFRAFEKTSEISSYFDEDTLASCDKITLNNRNFTAPLVFVPNNDDDNTSTYVTYIIESPVRRLADNAANLLNFAAVDTTCSGAYVFNPTEEDLKEYGFDNPIATLSIQVGPKTRTILVAPAPEEDTAEEGSTTTYYAAIDEERRAIYKIDNFTIPFVEASMTEYYNKYLTLEMLNELSGFIATTPEKTYDFSVTYDEEAPEGEDFTIIIDGRQLDQKNFQNFYQYFVSLEAIEYTQKNLDDVEPSLTIRMRHTKASIPDTVMVFRKDNDQRYQVEVGDGALGMVSSAAFNKLLNYLELASNNQSVPIN